MGNLVKMDWYRLRSSTFFLVNMIVCFTLNLATAIFVPVLARMLAPKTVGVPVEFSSLFTKTDAFPFIFAFMLVSLVSFSYSDLANGYIKNIAGQLPNKGFTVISKFIVIAIHNFIFMLIFLSSNMIGTFIMKKVIFDTDQLFMAVTVFFVKWMLTMALSAILLFVSTGLKNKTIASVLGVLLGSGLLSLVYMGLNNLFQNKVDVNEYAPDVLLGNLGTQSLGVVINAVLVSIICVAVFLPLTVQIFKTRDVK